MDEAKRGQFTASVIKLMPDFEPEILVAWAAHETAQFEKVIGWNNFLGMKMPKNAERRAMIDRPAVRVPTTEIIGYDRPDQMAGLINRVKKTDLGKIYWQPKKQRWVIKLHDYFADWSREDKAMTYLRRYLEDLFPAALEAKTEPFKFVSALVDGPRKYATDPDYKDSWMGMYLQVKGEER